MKHVLALGLGCVCLATLVYAAEDAAVLEAPRAGWRHSAGERRGYVQPVHYPASSVNTEAAEAAALITGRLAARVKGVASVVVNGVPLPLQTAGDGSFARPYAFGAGSNSVEIRADGRSLARRQFFDAYADKASVKLRVILAWDTDGTDVDLHVVEPQGGHAFWGERVTSTGGALDIDVTTGFGPEIYAHPSPAPGVYLIFVNYYGAGELVDDLTVAQVTLIFSESTPDEKRQCFTVPLRRPGELTFVHAFLHP